MLLSLVNRQPSLFPHFLPVPTLCDERGHCARGACNTHNRTVFREPNQPSDLSSRLFHNYIHQCETTFSSHLSRQWIYFPPTNVPNYIVVRIRLTSLEFAFDRSSVSSPFPSRITYGIPRSYTRNDESNNNFNFRLFFCCVFSVSQRRFVLHFLLASGVRAVDIIKRHTDAANYLFINVTSSIHFTIIPSMWNNQMRPASRWNETMRQIERNMGAGSGGTRREGKSQPWILSVRWDWEDETHI